MDFKSRAWSYVSGVYTSIKWWIKNLSHTNNSWTVWAVSRNCDIYFPRLVLFDHVKKCLLDSPEQIKYTWHHQPNYSQLLAVELSVLFRAQAKQRPGNGDQTLSLYGVLSISSLCVQCFCYQSHTVCLHLLVLYCNNSPFAFVHLQLLSYIYIFCPLCLSYFCVLYFVKMIYWLAQLLHLSPVAC